MSPPPVYALRVCPRADAARWWASARLAFHVAPPAVRAILTGRSRVEVSAQEAREALEWARGIDGWEADGVAPLYVVRGGDDYPEGGRGPGSPPLPSGL